MSISNQIIIPDEIVENVKNGKCILFLGAMASAPSPERSCLQYNRCPPSSVDLSRRLADKCGYPPNEDKDNLQKVSLYYQFRKGGSRYSLVQAIKNEIRKPDIEPSPALHMLAALPFPIIITTNYDDLFDNALRRAKTRKSLIKHPKILIYNPDLKAPPAFAPLDPSEEEPILLKLHGDIDSPDSIVVTEEDYINFIQKMNSPHYHAIHGNTLSRIDNFPLLFIGYSLKDYNLRLLFRTLRWHDNVANFPLSFSVDPSPDDIIVSLWSVKDKPMVDFIRQNLWYFVPALYKECMGVEYV